MFKSLKGQLMASSIAAIVLLILSVWLITRSYLGWSIVILCIVCAYIVLVNIWFWRCVSMPIDKLTSFAKRIAGGSYGIKLDDKYVNELGSLTSEINDMSEKVAMAEKSRTEFVSQVSHELRTPLTAITGWAETIAYDPAVQGDSLRGVNIIFKEAERLTGMVAELLEFTRIQDGRFNLRVELIDIAAELEDALFTYGDLIKQAGLKINYTPPPVEIPLIPGDPERLKQVFSNLLDNASKHGGDGDKIDVTLSSDANGVHIVFRDYGHGIPEAELPHVKEKFYKGSSKNRGTGIGLSVCDEIITRHNGALDITNAEGGGCKVSITLPLKAS